MKKRLLIAVLPILFLAGCITTTRDAEQVGYITAVENNGAIFRTWAVYTKSELESSQEELWCVEDKDVVDKLKNFRDRKTRVRLNYFDEMVIAPWRCSTHNIISGVESL